MAVSGFGLFMVVAASVSGCGWLWMVVGWFWVVVGGCWMVLAACGWFGWFWVVVLCFVWLHIL